MILDDLRQMIDQTNGDIIVLFSRRLSVTRKIARVKKENALPVHDPLREERQLKMLREHSQTHGLSPAIMEDIFNLFVDYCKMNMKMEMNNDEKNRLPRNLELEDLRDIIDQINGDIIVLFSRRLEITKKIARVKKENKLPVHDPLREEEQLKMLRELSQTHGLSPAIMEDIFNLFVNYCKLHMKMEMGQ